MSSPGTSASPTPASATSSPAERISLDGRRFVMLSSTASAVDPESPSWFDYHERDGAVWGEYGGDTVTFGRFVGTRDGDTIHVTFVHVLVPVPAGAAGSVGAGGSVVSGTSSSVIRRGENGLELVEDFVIDGVDHVSVCVESV
jgi:hypothetical protein